MPESDSKKICPQCGKKSLLVTPRGDGSVEMTCLNIECDFMETAQSWAGVYPGNPDPGAAFARRIAGQSDAKLNQMKQNLTRCSQSLTGQAGRTASRQLAIVNKELSSRRGQNSVTTSQKNNAVKKSPTSYRRKAVDTDKRENLRNMPSHLATPQARAKRIEGIRQYHGSKKQEPNRDLQPAKSKEPTGIINRLQTITKTLHQEAMRHEQAARDCAKTPELFPLHIDHSARAFELNRVRDLLGSWLESQTSPRTNNKNT